AGALPQAEVEWRAFGAKRRHDCLRHESDFLILGLGRLYASHGRASSGTGYAVRFLRSQRETLAAATPQFANRRFAVLRGAGAFRSDAFCHSKDERAFLAAAVERSVACVATGESCGPCFPSFVAVAEI